MTTTLGESKTNACVDVQVLFFSALLCYLLVFCVFQVLFFAREAFSYEWALLIHVLDTQGVFLALLLQVLDTNERRD